MRHVLSSIGLFLVCAITLTGCGSTTTADSGQATTVAKSAKASFSVTIPTKVTKSLIPNGTSYVYVSWVGIGLNANTYSPGELYLYPDTTGTATGSADLVPGTYTFNAYCYDANGTQLSLASSMANISSGTNNIKITFISGRWTFASPIALSQGEKLSSFDVPPLVSANYYNQSYPITFNIVDSANTPLSPPNASMDFMSISGDLSTLAAMYGLPVLTAGSTLDILSMEYNVNQQSSYSNWAPGDRILVTSSVGPAQTGSSSPDISAYFNTKFSSGTSLTGTLLEFTYGSRSTKPATSTTGLCTQQYPYKQASFRSTALAAATSSKVTKAAAASPISSVTLTYPDCEPNYLGRESFTDSNGNGYYDFGEPFVDANSNGQYDYGTYIGLTEVTVTEIVNNVYVYPFTATGADIPTQILVKPISK